MKTLLAVSPHLDDAIFSAGALLARHAAAGWRVVVATCFTASSPDPQGFALACQLDKGLAADVDYMALRRAEDQAACALIGADAVHLPFFEAPHRGYDSAPALFGSRLTGDDVGTRLAAALTDVIGRFHPDRLLGPACIGDHVDHWVTRDALERAATGPITLWADLPYAGSAGAPLPPAASVLACDSAWPRKLAAIQAYQSQLGFQFGAVDRIAGVIGADETFWAEPSRNPFS